MNLKMRIYHRYLGFFLAGIMAVYAISGIILIFRDTDAFKIEEQVEEVLPEKVPVEELGRRLRIRDLKVEKIEDNVAYFEGGTYDMNTLTVNYTKKELPTVLEKMEHLHKAKTGDPLFFLNIFFGLGLFFFVISSFWMFIPGTDIFKKGLYFTLAGLVLTLVMLLL
ncbi:MAG: hypothetical protein CL843_07435 [Crocinitomicaceae bacterium]|nr:hypothetical protein [Crocinitomicaceae bacterium]|tara:strand:+ start:1153 stop:1650 length:498 start_codon:yes stop_codon:yes gene_type:complete